MIHQIPKTGKKRQFSQDIKVRGVRKTQPPENQDFVDGFSIVMDTYAHNAQTGNRDRKTGRVYARFQTAEQLSNFWEENRRIIYKPKKDATEPTMEIETPAEVACV